MNEIARWNGMNNLKSIETKYNGYIFRSRLEARWAIYFDYVGIKWEYEIDGFEFPDKTKYIPDFWFPEQKHWAEVKAQEFNESETHKAHNITRWTGKPLIKLIGSPEDKEYSVIEYLGENKGKHVWTTTGNCWIISMFPFRNNYFYYDAGGILPSELCSDILPAIDKSRKFRWEAK